MKRYDRLSQLEIKKPCSADWNEMSGDDATRYCGKCRKNVHNLSEMGADEAEALLQSGSVCVRYRSDDRGRIITKNAVIAGLALLAVGCESSPELTGRVMSPDDRTSQVLTGETAPPPEVQDKTSVPPADQRMTMGAVAMPTETMGKVSTPDSRGDATITKTSPK
jgi:hypothetical protein